MARSKRSRQALNQEFAGLSQGSDPPPIRVTPREDEFNEKTWWMVDLSPVSEITSTQGASAIVKRCMRTHGWDEAKAKKVLAAYRQFLLLKKEHEDWNAEILSPCTLVEQMWRIHILDVVNYCHDMMFLCGHVLGHNPDDAMDVAAKLERDETTRSLLLREFGSYDGEVWDNSPTHIDEVNETNNETGEAAVKWEDSTIVDQPDEVKEANNETDEALRAIVTQPIITVKDREGEGQDLLFKLNRTTEMSRLFNAYARKKNLPVEDISFLFNGEVLDPSATPDSCGLEGRGTIDAEVVAKKPAAITRKKRRR